MDILPIINISIWTIAKAMVLFALGIYIVFAVVVLRQIRLMSETLKIGLEKGVRTLGVIHLLFSIAVFILALIIL